MWKSHDTFLLCKNYFASIKQIDACSIKSCHNIFIGILCIQTVQKKDEKVYIVFWVSMMVSVTLVLLERLSLCIILLVRDAADSSGWVSLASTSMLASSKSLCSI